jgi:hypothetical protein
MKVLKYIAIALFVFGCKTKKVTIDKVKENEFSEMKRHFDSTYNLYLKHQLDWQKNQIDFSSNLVLTSAPVLDSSGNRIPFHYKHFVDGNLKEEIILEGGEINAITETNETKIDEKKQESKVEKGKIDVDVGIKKAAAKSKKAKAKKAEVKGFQFGFYLWLFLIIVVLIVLYWISKKLKLPDKFTSLFGNKGG